ncbi:hypothetical protein GLAREA_00528 [Glarea lozoyensis ATCC 20868]|uniref:U6 snRNA phosphodiesterase n=1 Tax=Glarea lozoyensis (strain ATCC 20868 / MF5171) TaxID=1116229 RepID=S3DSG9_GLAL2|nr:uncharacterized protein GLAREA_00528 [Glarea lozoyensis ATCC 20868]EPE29368.1 hypothetical protein GLAREA_00528 [Glarea lozoyensis ATCC 20868]
MALVDYTSSSSDEDNPKNSTASKDQVIGGKRKHDTKEFENLPPLPSKFHDLYASTTRASTRDDPSLHSGRKRGTPHIEGNWPTHLYIEWCPPTTEHIVVSDFLAKLIEATATQNDFAICSFLSSDLGAPLPLHISLSRPIGLVTADKENFVELLERVIRTCGIRPFDVTISGVDWVSNFDNTRWFLVLRLLKPPHDGLNKLLHLCNDAVGIFGQPPLYARKLPQDTPSPKRLRRPDGKSTSSSKAPTIASDWTGLGDPSSAFHISIAWALKAPSQETKDITSDLFQKHNSQLSQIHVPINEIKAKVGNVVTNLTLRAGGGEGTSLFGI